MPSGTRTDLACPKCHARMGGLHTRPGQAAIARSCDECGHIELAAPPQPGRCKHDVTVPLYKRMPRSEGSSYRSFPDGRYCTCGRVV